MNSTTINSQTGNIIEQVNNLTNKSITNNYINGVLVSNTKTDNGNIVAKYDNNVNLANKIYGGVDKFADINVNKFADAEDYNPVPNTNKGKNEGSMHDAVGEFALDFSGIIGGGAVGVYGGLIFKTATTGLAMTGGLGIIILGAGILGYGIYRLGRNFGWWGINNDPLAFDKGNDGFKTKPETIDFDIDGDGIADKINDVDEFVLAFDSNNSGIAGENGLELFGDGTDLDGDGKPDGYKDGFEALKALALKYDLISVNDNVLDAEDLKFLQNKVGLSMKDGYKGESYTFEELGITAINLPSTDEVETQEDFDGQGNNLMTQQGATFVIDGEEVEYADVWHKKR